MIGFVLVAHGELAASMVAAVAHVTHGAPPQLRSVDVKADMDCGLLEAQLREAIGAVDDGSGVIVFSDIYGATPANMATRVLRPGHVEGIAGMNLPMVIKALGIRQQPLAQVVETAIERGAVSVVNMTADCCNDHSRKVG
jgi:mannose PTS system EIIA component